MSCGTFHCFTFELELVRQRRHSAHDIRVSTPRSPSGAFLIFSSVRRPALGIRATEASVIPVAIFIFLFTFMGGFAAVFTYFVSRLLFPGADPAQTRKARNIAFVAVAFLPIVLLGIFTITRPGGAPMTGAVIPALWVFCMLAGIALGLAAAHRARASEHRNARPG